MAFSGSEGTVDERDEIRIIGVESGLQGNQLGPIWEYKGSMSRARSILDSVSRVQCGKMPSNLPMSKRSAEHQPTPNAVYLLEMLRDPLTSARRHLECWESLCNPGLVVASSNRAHGTCHRAYMYGLVNLVILFVRLVEHSLYLYSSRYQVAVGDPTFFEHNLLRRHQAVIEMIVYGGHLRGHQLC